VVNRQAVKRTKFFGKKVHPSQLTNRPALSHELVIAETSIPGTPRPSRSSYLRGQPPSR
jgi:hypothetical protein